jgi:large subunit ribosomal protein L10
MSRQVKDLVIADIQNRVGSVRDFVVVDCSRLDAITANKWRLSLRKDRIQALTVKNSVAAAALRKNGLSGIETVLSGPSTLVWGSDDIVGLSKAVTRYSKEIPKLEIRGGTVDGQALDASGIDTLSKSAGRLETIGELLGLMVAPGRQLAGCLQSPGGRLTGAVKTIADKE